MKDYATFLFGFTLCIAGCSASTAGNPSTGTSGVNTASAGTPATTVTTPAQPSAAGMAATGAAGVSASSAGSAAKPSTVTAGSSATTATGTAGSSAAAAGSGAGATMAAAAPGSWRAAYLAIFDASVSQCAQCHVSGGLLSPPDFSTPDKAYDSIVDKDSSSNPQAQCHGMGKYIVPGNCEESLLYNKLSQDMPKCGRRMPPSSDAMPMRVAQDKLDLLCMWIKAGAKKD